MSNPPPRKNDNAPYFIQTRTFQRGLLRYAFEETGGDLEWASAILGISEEFFRIQADRLGGVFPGVAVNEPPLEVAQVVREAPVPAIVPILPEPPKDEVITSSAPSNGEAHKIPFSAVVEESTIEAKELPPIEDLPLEAVADTASSEESVEGSSDEEPEETRGRKPAVSPDPKFMTRREVETLLNLSTAGVLRLRTKGDLEAISSPELGGALLFPRDKVEEFAKKRSEQREKRKSE